jgi:bis(5'-nucleosidyl)-tetraphosphatase
LGTDCARRPFGPPFSDNGLSLAAAAWVDYLIHMPSRERSAGIILFHNHHGRRYLLLDYGRHWDYPKGHLKKGETDLEAAERELHEETGLTAARFVPDFAREIRYFFRSGKKLIDKTVIFFLAETDKEKVHLSDEHIGYAWLDYETALDRLTYANAKDVLRAAEAHLSD